MSEQSKYTLGEDRIPRVWYNIAADLPGRRRRSCIPAPASRSAPTTSRRCSRWRSSARKSAPSARSRSPIRCARSIACGARRRSIARARLEKALGTTARIFYKYEGVSPAGSHKPNTAVAQAFYNKQEGVKKLTTETGAGQWGSSLAFAGALFGLEVKVYMVRVSYDQKPYRRALMETYGATCVASPSNETDVRPRHPRRSTRIRPGSLGIAISEAVEVAAQNADTKYSLGSVLNHVLLHQTVIGHGGDRADGGGRRLSRRRHRLRRRRLEFRRHRLPVPRQEAARQARRARHRGRAGGLPVADARHATPSTSATPAT